MESMRNYNEHDVKVEIAMARDEFGEPLNRQTQAAFLAFFVAPSMYTWREIADVVIFHRPDLRLWQACAIVDESFTARCATYSGEQILSWSDFPDDETVREALRYATH